MIGRRRDDLPLDRLPDDLQPGDYWKCLRGDGEFPIIVRDEPSNLTGTMWGFCSPIGGVGMLRKHTVRENDDRTINVLPDDGSSNSILFKNGEDGQSWHGFIYDGEWRELG